MYKIYINKTAIRLADSKEVKNLVPTKKHLVYKYHGSKGSLLNFIDTAEKTDRYENITLHSDKEEQLIQDFFKLFKIVEAAGGLVHNPKGEVLMIFRRDSWDLPKGKIDPGETPDEASVREVQEETGIQNIKLGPLLHTSYHTYKNRKGNRVLKPTYWYHMETTDLDLIPQAEEDIEEAVWIDKAEFLASDKPVYRSIKDVLLVKS